MNPIFAVIRNGGCCKWNCIIAIILVASAGLIFSQPRDVNTKQLSMEENRSNYENIADLKQSVQWAEKWWELNFSGANFAICLQEFPSYGQSNHTVKVWRRGLSGKFDLVWMFRAEGTGPVKVIVDDKIGTLQVDSIAKKESGMLGFYSLIAVRD